MPKRGGHTGISIFEAQELGGILDPNFANSVLIGRKFRIEPYVGTCCTVEKFQILDVSCKRKRIFQKQGFTPARMCNYQIRLEYLRNQILCQPENGLATTYMRFQIKQIVMGLGIGSRRFRYPKIFMR